MKAAGLPEGDPMKKVMVLTSAILCMVTLAWAGPLDPAQVAAGAKWVAHVDLEALRASQFGGLLLGELKTDAAQAKIAAFKAIFAFDPVQDIKSLTVFGDKTSPQNGVAILKGAFDPEKVLVLLRANDSYKASDYGSHAVHTWTDDKSGAPEKTHWGCFHSAGMAVIAGTRERLVEAIDVLDGKGAAQPADSRLKRLLPKEQGVVMAAALQGIADGEALPPEANMLQNADGASLGLWEDNQKTTLEVKVEAKTVEAATAMQQMVQGLLAFGAVNQNPDPLAAAITQSAKVTTDDRTVMLRIQCGSEQLFNAMKQAHEKKLQQQQAGQQPATP